MKNVLLGIITWNHWRVTERCVKSIREHTDLTNVKFVIFDNGSDDKETIDWLDNCGIEIIRFKDNYGICGGMRKAFEYSFKDDEIEFVCLPNPDILVTDEWLKRLIDVIKEGDDILIVEPKDNNKYQCYQHFFIPPEYCPSVRPDGAVFVFEDDSKLQEYISESFYAKRKHPASVSVESVDPPMALWRKSLVKDMGNLNKRYDYGLGVIELFLRAPKKGYRIVYCLSSFIYHLAHGGAGKYEGYEKKFGRHLNEYVADEAGLINHIYGTDIAGIGSGGGRGALAEIFLKEEKKLVALEG